MNWHFRVSSAGILFLCGCYLFGVSTRTFRFHSTTVGIHTGHEAEAWALVPTDREGPVPVVVFLHGSGGSLQKSGTTLRMIVDQGYAAVGLEYSKRDKHRLRRQIDELLDWIAVQTWSQKDAVVWMGFSLGAQRYLYYLANTSRSPAVLIRVAGGTLRELESGFPRSLSIPVWMIHGENDRVIPLSDVKQLKKTMMRAGANVRLDVLPQQTHGVKKERGVIIKLLIDRLKEHFHEVSLP